MLTPQPTTCLIYFVRHGQTDDNAQKNWGGNDLKPLNDIGIQEAKKVCEDLKNVPFDRAFNSTTLRTHQTAQIILKDRRMIRCEDPFFNEMRIGPFKGMSHNEIITFFCKQTHYPHPSTKTSLPRLWEKLNGEPILDPNDCLLDQWRPDVDSFEDFRKKALVNIQKLAKDNLGKILLVVTHSTYIKCAANICTQVPISLFKNKTGSWICVEVDSEGNCQLRKQKGVSLPKNSRYRGTMTPELNPPVD